MNASRKTGRYIGGYTDRFGVKYRGYEEYEALRVLICGFCGNSMPTGSNFIRKQGLGFGSRRVPICLSCAGLTNIGERETD